MSIVTAQHDTKNLFSPTNGLIYGKMSLMCIKCKHMSKSEIKWKLKVHKKIQKKK